MSSTPVSRADYTLILAELWRTTDSLILDNMETARESGQSYEDWLTGVRVRLTAVRHRLEAYVPAKPRDEAGPAYPSNVDPDEGTESKPEPYGWTYTWADDDFRGGLLHRDHFSRKRPDPSNPHISEVVPLYRQEDLAESGEVNKIPALPAVLWEIAQAYAAAAAEHEQRSAEYSSLVRNNTWANPDMAVISLGQLHGRITKLHTRMDTILALAGSAFQRWVEAPETFETSGDEDAPDPALMPSLDELEDAGRWLDFVQERTKDPRERVVSQYAMRCVRSVLAQHRYNKERAALGQAVGVVPEPASAPVPAPVPDRALARDSEPGADLVTILGALDDLCQQRVVMASAAVLSADSGTYLDGFHRGSQSAAGDVRTEIRHLVPNFDLAVERHEAAVVRSLTQRGRSWLGDRIRKALPNLTQEEAEAAAETAFPESLRNGES